MGKIDVFEQRIIEVGMTEKDFVEYGKMLKRVPGNFSKRQHCYTTAIQFPPERAEQAVKLIQFGLDCFEDGWFSTYTSYLYVGHIFEKARNYSKAYESYLLAKDALGSDHPEYTKELSKDLLWMKLHIDSFRYSKDLETYYLCYLTSDTFSRDMVSNELKTAVASIVIALHYGEIEKARQSLETAKEICTPNYLGKLHSILSRHNYRELMNITQEAIAFINSVQL